MAKRNVSTITDVKGDLIYEERKRWLILGLPLTFTVYKIYENDLQICSGLLTSSENDCYMYRISDIKLKKTLLQKLFGLGTVICYTSDTTTPEIHLKNIRNSSEIKDFIYRASEESKMRRRTVNMQNIGAGQFENDSFDDFM